MESITLLFVAADKRPRKVLLSMEIFMGFKTKLDFLRYLSMKQILFIAIIIVVGIILNYLTRKYWNK